jgi:hypothetical protein
MIIYNTTFQVDDDVHSNFLIWMKECYIPEVQQHGTLTSPRLTRILSHHADGTSYALQWEVPSTAMLHAWHTQLGERLNSEMQRIFKDKVVSFPTLMEVVE